LPPRIKHGRDVRWENVRAPRHGFWPALRRDFAKDLFWAMMRWLGQWLLSARRAKRTKRAAADRALTLMGLSIILVA